MKTAAVLGLVLLSSCAAAAKEAITHEDLWLMRRLSQPVPSPDGKWVVVTVTEPAYDAARQQEGLWIVPADGSEPARRITHSRAAEGSPAWSPDSNRLAFTAKRDGDEAPQVYILDLTKPGEAVRVTSISTGAAGPKFSPDGQSILFQSSVFPGAADDEANRKLEAERKARKYNARVYDGFPIRYWDKWLDDKERHIFVQPLQPDSRPRDLLAGSRMAAEAGFGGASTTSGQDLQPVWAPDGRSIVFTATVNRNQGAYAPVKTDIYQVPVEGGEPKALTSGAASYSKPAFRPDGRGLYCLREQVGEKVYHLERLVMLSWPAGEETVLTAGFDRAVSSFAFSPDSRTVYFTAEDAAHEKLYAVPAEGGEVKQVGDLKTGSFSNLAGAVSAAQTLLVANHDAAVSPPEVVRIDAGTGAHEPLTSFNRERAANIDLPALREFWFTDSKGKKIHNLIALPPNFREDRKYPLLVVMHGGPNSMWRDQWVLRWNYHLLAKPGYVVLLTNYSGSTGYGEEFAQSIHRDPLAGPAREINEAADAAIAKYSFIDGSRQAAAGASYGGHLANWMQASTTRYKCLISHAGLINLESQWGTSDTIYHRELGMGGPVWEGDPLWREQNPIRYAAKFRTPMLLTVGENDFRVPLNQTIENWSVLQRMKVPSRLIVFPEENHWIMGGENSRFWYGEVHKWLAKYLDSSDSVSSGSR